MEKSIIINNAYKTKIKVTHNKRAKRVILKIRHGQVQLVIPRRVSVKHALTFLDSKIDWIDAKLDQQPQKIVLDINTDYKLFGQECEIIYGGLRGKTEITGQQLVVRGDALTANKKIKKLLYQQLRNEIEKIAALKSEEAGLQYKKISIRNNISRWGSCSTKGNLSFCWRLVFAPYEVVEYLVCHELAHLKEMNHSAKFWAVVEMLYPGYEKAESWLKKNGNSLYLYE